MKTLLRCFLSTLCVFSVFFADLALSASNFDTSSELTTLYRSARKVISDNQALINTADVADKGLSGEAVVQKALANYQAQTGNMLEMSTLTEAQAAMLEAVREVMDENQELINEQGVGFKGFLPAVFARHVATSFSEKMGGKMTIKLTAPKAYVRNRSNRPDKWEANIIESMFKAASYEKGKPFSEEQQVKGKAAYRFILPEYYGASCLGCHGEPKGTKDITGGKREGGKLNELGGAISLTIFK